MSRCPVESLLATSGQLWSRKFHTPRSLAGALLPYEAHFSHLAPAPGPLQLGSLTRRGLGPCPRPSRRMCVCVFRALQGTPGPTLTPHIMQQEEEVGFWVDWGPPWKHSSLQGCPALWAWQGQGREGPADVLRQ